MPTNLPAPVQFSHQRALQYRPAPIIFDVADDEKFELGELPDFPVYSENSETEDQNFTKNSTTLPSGFILTAQRPTLTFAPSNPTVASISLQRAKKMAASNTTDVKAQIGPFLVEATTMDVGGLDVDFSTEADDFDLANAKGWFLGVDDEKPTIGTQVDVVTGPAAAGEFSRATGNVFTFDASDVGKEFTYYVPSRSAIDIIEAVETPITTVRAIAYYVDTDLFIKVVDGLFRPVPGGDLLGGTQEITLLSVSDPTVCATGARIYTLPKTERFLVKC